MVLKNISFPQNKLIFRSNLMSRKAIGNDSWQISINTGFESHIRTAADKKQTQSSLIPKFKSSSTPNLKAQTVLTATSLLVQQLSANLHVTRYLETDLKDRITWNRNRSSIPQTPTDSCQDYYDITCRPMKRYSLDYSLLRELAQTILFRKRHQEG